MFEKNVKKSGFLLVQNVCGVVWCVFGGEKNKVFCLSVIVCMCACMCDGLR